MKRTTFLLLVGSLLVASNASANGSKGCSPTPQNPAVRQARAMKSASGPTVSNVEFIQVPKRVGRGSRVVVTYDLASPQGPCEVSLRVSDNGGFTYDIVPQTLTGAVGADVTPGVGKQIVWDISADLPNISIPDASVQVIADDGSCPDCKLWSDPATWGGTVPAAGQNVTIPADWHVILDQNVDLAGLEIEGTLEFARQDLTLEAAWIAVSGDFIVGSPSDPFTQRATIRLDDTNTGASHHGMGTRGIMVMSGGQLSLHGTSPAVAWTKVADHVPAANEPGASTTVPLAAAVDWRAGDQVVLAPTDFHTVTPTAQLGITERLPLAADASGNTITLAQLPNHRRWGRLQYATTSGMSLTPPAPGSPEEIVLGPGLENTPLVLDQRAAIGNLTRNIVIEAPNDPVWQNQGFGVHVMVMGTGSAAYIDGVEIRRGGQHFSLGRYPFHWHMLSYSPPNTLADATGQYFRNSVINESRNRGVVVHGTNGVLVENNIIYNVRGHGIFTEDAVERRNTFDNNLVLRILNPTQALKLHETELGSPGVNGGASGFWISNPDNTVTNNHAADCQGMGFWLAFTFQAWGDSTGTPINPQRLPLTAFSHNTSHSNRFRGVLIDLVEGDPDGRVGVGPQQYIPTSDPDGDGLGAGAAYENRVPFELTDLSLWKNGHNAIWDRASGPQNRRIIAADNANKAFAGSGEEGLIENCLVIGESLNNTSAFPNQSGVTHPIGFATYHGAFSIQRNVVLNFDLVPGQTSGAFAEDDFYFRPVEKSTLRNSGNVLINSHPGFKSVPDFAGTLSHWVLYPQTAPGQQFQFPPFASYFTFAQAKWDPHGWAGPAGNYLVYNAPFFTHEATLSPITPDTLATAPETWGSQVGAVSASGPYYGFTAFVLHGVGPTLPQNFDYADLMALEVRRYDLQDLSLVDTWKVEGICCPDVKLAHMRDFAAHRDGIYELDFPYNERHPGWNLGAQYRYPTNLRMEFENMLTPADTLLIGIEFSGAIQARVRTSPSPTRDGGGNQYAVTTYQLLGDFEAVRNSVGGTYWQDTTNNRVWVKLRGGDWVSNGQPYAANSDQLIYETTYLRIDNILSPP